jgi:hypothetical protein
MPPFALERSGDRNQPEQVIGFARIRIPTKNSVLHDFLDFSDSDQVALPV